MQLVHEKREIQSQGVQSSGTYSMELNGKTFEMMTSTLYKNKIGSIVREIGCNALDAHRMAGKDDVPFLIHIPTALEPWFTVQDFGTGLSPENFENVYKVLGKSTKDGSNDDIGAFGLGAKTPYSYGEKSFILVNRYEGVEYQYSAFVDDTNMPQLALMQKTDTTESNGLTVKIPVESEDFWDFKNEIKEQYKFFTLKPEIENEGLDFEWLDTAEPALTIGDVQIMNVEGHSHYDRKIHIVQGPVGYPLVIDEIEDKISDENKETLSMLRNSGAIITFDIGEIGVTISREDVDYNKPTIANIEKKLQMFRDNMADHLEQKLNGFDNDWKRAIELNKSVTLRSLAKASSYTIDNTYRNGNQLKFNAHEHFTRIVEEEKEHMDGTKYTYKRTLRDYKLVTYKKNNNGNISMKTSKHPDELEATEDIKSIYVRDTSSQPISRVKHEMLVNGYDMVVVLTIGSDNIKTATTAFTKPVVKKISKLFGGIDMTRVSDLAKPPAPIRNSNSDKVVGYVLPKEHISQHGSNNMHSTYDWRRAHGSVEDIEPDLYVTSDRYDIQCDYGILNKYEKLVQCGLIDNTLYAFNPTNTAKVENIDGWVKLEDFVEENYKKVKSQFADYIELAVMSELNDMTEKKHTAKYVLAHDLDIESELAKWYFRVSLKMDKIYKWKKKKLSDAQAKFYKIFEFEIIRTFADDIANEDIIKKYKKAKKLFRLLPSFSSWRDPNEDEIEHITQYVNCMGKGA